MYQIDNAHIRDTCVRLQANLAGTAVRIAHLDVISLDLRTELAQAVLIELREGETAIASETTATHALGQEDVVRAEFGEVDEIIGHTHLTG